MKLLLFWLTHGHILHNIHVSYFPTVSYKGQFINFIYLFYLKKEKKIYFSKHAKI